MHGLFGTKHLILIGICAAIKEKFAPKKVSA